MKKFASLASQSPTIQKHLYVILAALLLLASLLPLFSYRQASAYQVLENRSIKMSSSASGATADGQNLTYEVQFDVTQTTPIGGVVIEFCSNSPIIGEACTTPADFFDATGTAVTLDAGLTDFAVHGSSTDTLIILTETDGEYTPTVSETIRFSLNSLDNPHTVNTAFYAKILTYGSAADAVGYTDTDPEAVGPVLDAGGIALSTAAQITVTAKVQERLTFCVYSDSTDPDYGNNDCLNKSGTDIILGDDAGVLRPEGPYVNTDARYSVTTNATGNAIIRLKGDTLTSGTMQTIDAIGDTPEGSNPGSEQFGLCTYEVAGSGLTITALYDGAQAVTVPSPDTGAGCDQTTHTSGDPSPGGDGGASFAFDTNNTDGTTSTYGQTIATKAAGDYSTGVLSFIGNISNITEAGIYTTVLTFIATGTY